MSWASFRSTVITQAIAVVCFVVMPVVITFVAPFSTLEFRRVAGDVDVVVTRYVLVFLPWRTQYVPQVARLRADIKDAEHRHLTASERRKGYAQYSFATAQVAILGAGRPEVIVQVAPDMAEDVVARFDAFRRDAAATRQTVEVYASWWLSYVLGGVVTALCALYVVGAVLAVVTWPFKRRRPA